MTGVYIDDATFEQWETCQHAGIARDKQVRDAQRKANDRQTVEHEQEISHAERAADLAEENVELRLHGERLAWALGIAREQIAAADDLIAELCEPATPRLALAA